MTKQEKAANVVQYGKVRAKIVATGKTAAAICAEMNVNATSYYAWWAGKKEKGLVPTKGKSTAIVEPIRAARPPKVTQFVLNDDDESVNIVLLKGSASAIERVLKAAGFGVVNG